TERRALRKHRSRARPGLDCRRAASSVRHLQVDQVTVSAKQGNLVWLQNQILTGRRLDNVGLEYDLPESDLAKIRRRTTEVHVLHVHDARLFGNIAHHLGK